MKSMWPPWYESSCDAPTVFLHAMFQNNIRDHWSAISTRNGKCCDIWLGMSIAWSKITFPLFSSFKCEWCIIRRHRALSCIDEAHLFSSKMFCAGTLPLSTQSYARIYLKYLNCLGRKFVFADSWLKWIEHLSTKIAARRTKIELSNQLHTVSLCWSIAILVIIYGTTDFTRLLLKGH